MSKMTVLNLFFKEPYINQTEAKAKFVSADAANAFWRDRQRAIVSDWQRGV